MGAWRAIGGLLLAADEDEREGVEDEDSPSFSFLLERL